MSTTNTDAYRRIAEIIRDAAFKSGGAMSNPVGAGQDLEDAARELGQVAPTLRNAEVEQLIARLRHEASFAQDYKQLARRPDFVARLRRLADELDRLAGDD